MLKTHKSAVVWHKWKHHAQNRDFLLKTQSCRVQNAEMCPAQM